MRFQVQYFQVYNQLEGGFPLQLGYIQGGNFSFQSAENGDSQPEGGGGQQLETACLFYMSLFQRCGERQHHWQEHFTTVFN